MMKVLASILHKKSMGQAGNAILQIIPCKVDVKMDATAD
jgi:hypothetical protein